MKLNSIIKNNWVHSLVILVFLFISFIYAFPVIKGKNLAQHDIVQATGAAKEITDYKEKTGNQTWWTNSMFSGMPSYTIKGDYPYSLTSKIGSFLSYKILPSTVNLIFLLLTGFYIMMVLLGFSPWLAFLGALAYAFSSYNIIIIEAGHVSKVLALAYAPILLAGIHLLFSKKFLLGSIVTSIGAALELYSNHIQITYYCIIAIFLYVLYQFYLAIKEKTIRDFVIATLISITIAVLVLGSMVSKFWTTYEYTSQSIRGPSVLKSDKTDGGLDKDYAFSWSYGVSETFTFLIPDYVGGSSSTALTDKSNTYQTLINYNLPKTTATDFVNNIYGYGGQLYWGNQPSTSGPAYMGAVVLLLFFLSFFVVKNNLKWVILSIIILFTMLSWGKNFMFLSEIFFDYVPLYNKFRAVTMIHSVIDIFIVLMACWGLKSIAEKKVSQSEITKYLKISTGVLGGLLIVFILFSGLREYRKGSVLDSGQRITTSDDQFQSILEQVTGNKKMAIDVFISFLSDRESAFRKDTFRSLIFVLLAAVLIWAYLNNKIKNNYLLAGLSCIVFADMVMISKRYLNNDDFIKTYQKPVNLTSADREILKDNDIHYRVMNTTVSPFNDATTSFYHKSVGGYSGAKLQRYQDVIEHHLSQGSMNVFNMLNTKYFITKKDQNIIAQKNFEAFGNAWFVNDMIIVNSPDTAITLLNKTDLKEIAIIEEEYSNDLGNVSSLKYGKGKIELTSYKPDELIYKANTSNKKLAVFSEVYYNNNLGWEAYIDGQKVPHIRVNYILRGLVIPQGEHEIKFVFKPSSYFVGEKIDLISSIILLGIILGSSFLLVRNEEE